MSAAGTWQVAVSATDDTHIYDVTAEDATGTSDPVRRTVRPAGKVAPTPTRFAAYADMGYDHILIRHLAEEQDEVLSSFARLARVRDLVAGL